MQGRPWTRLAVTFLSLPALTCRQVGELHSEPWVTHMGFQEEVCPELICFQSLAWPQAKEGNHS